jgi:hypothetical protein
MHDFPVNLTASTARVFVQAAARRWTAAVRMRAVEYGKWI